MKTPKNHKTTILKDGLTADEKQKVEKELIKAENAALNLKQILGQTPKKARF